MVNVQCSAVQTSQIDVRCVKCFKLLCGYSDRWNVLSGDPRSSPLCLQHCHRKQILCGFELLCLIKRKMELS